MRQLIRTILWCLLGYLSSTSPARADKVVLIAGGGTAGDGAQATAAKVLMPFGMAFDGSGNLYLVEFIGQRVRRIDSKGIISTVAGTGEQRAAGVAGPAMKAAFNAPHA